MVSDWYALVDRMDSSEMIQILDTYSKEELKVFCVNLIRAWAFHEKQSEIKQEHFYREIISLLNER